MKTSYFYAKIRFLSRGQIYLFTILAAFALCFSGKVSARSDSSANKRLWIREIIFTGNKITRPQIMLREMTIQVGDSIAAKDLENEVAFNKRRILNLQLFSSVNYEIRSIDSATVDIVFQVIELFYWIPKPEVSLADRNFNVWWKEMQHKLERTNIGLQITRINFRGRSERIGGTAQVGYNKYFDVYYKIPFIDKYMKRGAGISATYSTGREINFRTTNNKLEFFHADEYPYRYFQTELTYTFRPAYAIIHELNLSYNSFAITDALYEKNRDFLGGKQKVNFLELKFTVAFNNTDVRVYPLNGLDAKLVVDKKGLWLDKDINQFSIRSELSYYKKFNRHFSSSLVFRGRICFPDEQPYFINRAMGFKNEYVRGYEYYVIDGTHYALGRANLRCRIIDRVIHQRIIAFMQYLPLRLYAKVYDDLGYVYTKNAGDSRLSNRFLNGYGAGLDLVVSYYFKFRVEYSFNHLGQNGLFLHGNKE